MTDILENYLQNFSVYRTILLCGSDEDALNLEKDLLKLNHTVMNIHENNLEEIVNFNSADYRLAIISFNVWKNYRTEIAFHILPHQNLLGLHNIDEYQLSRIKFWINIADKFGYINPELDPCVITLDKI